MRQLGDYIEDYQYLNFKFNTRTLAQVPASLSSGAVSVYKRGTTTPSTAGITLTTDYNGVTGLNDVLIDLSAAAFYESGYDYDVVLSAGAVDGISVVGTVLAEFSIRNKYVNVSQIEGGDATDQINAACDTAVSDAGVTTIRMGYLDAAITSRSSHSAADVWAVTTRTLSSFGTLVSDITTAVWSAGTRTLSGFGTLIADVWNYATRALTDKAGFTISGTKQTLDALNDVSSSTVRTQADAALTAYDAPTKAELDAAVAPLATSAALSAVDDYIDTEVAAIKAVTDKLDTAMESDGGVYRFTANALEEGPSGTSGGGDATAENQATIIAHLTDIKGTGFSGATDSLEAIRDRGDSAWITGSGLSGSNAVVIDVHDDDGANIVEAAVEIWDSAGTTFYERKTSDSSGQASFNMDDGTYTVKIHKAGYSKADQTLVVPDTLAPVYVMTAFVIPVSPDLTKCRVWMKLINTYTSLTATANVPENLTGNNLVMGNYTGVYDTVNNLVYWDLPIGAVNSVLKITELNFEVVVPLIFDLESSELKDLI